MPLPWWQRDDKCMCRRSPHPRNLCCNSLSGSEVHTGELQVVEWGWVPPDEDELEGYGDEAWQVEGPKAWGGTDYMDDEGDGSWPFGYGGKGKAVFYEECGGDAQRLYERLDPGVSWLGVTRSGLGMELRNAFRWTCCGQGPTIAGCAHHGTGCRCDRCHYEAHGHSDPRREAMGMTTADGPPKYLATVENRFLRLPRTPASFSEWDLARHVPWSPEAHRHLPRAFKEQTKVLLLAWKRRGLPEASTLVLAFMPHFWLISLEWGCEQGRLFPPGSEVEIHGLQGSKQHNGKHGVVQKFSGKRERYVINIGGGDDIVAVKPRNLNLALPKVENDQQQARAKRREDENQLAHFLRELGIGRSAATDYARQLVDQGVNTPSAFDRLSVERLRDHYGFKRGHLRVVAQARLEPEPEPEPEPKPEHSKSSLKRARAKASKKARQASGKLAADGYTTADDQLGVTAVHFEPGSEVVIHGLVSATHYNGKRGTVQKFSDKKGRYVVQTADGPLVAMKPGNLSLAKSSKEPEPEPEPAIRCQTGSCDETKMTITTRQAQRSVEQQQQQEQADCTHPQVQEAIKLLKSKSAKQRMRGLKRLANAPDPDVSPHATAAVALMLDDEDDEQVMKAGLGLLSSSSAPHVPAVISIMFRGEGGALGWSALHELKKISKGVVSPHAHLIAERLTDGSAEVRALAVHALRDLGPAAATYSADIAERLADSSARVRAQAFGCVQTLGPSCFASQAALASVVGLLSRPDKKNRSRSRAIQRTSLRLLNKLNIMLLGECPCCCGEMPDADKPQCELCQFRRPAPDYETYERVIGAVASAALPGACQASTCALFSLPLSLPIASLISRTEYLPKCKAKHSFLLLLNHLAVLVEIISPPFNDSEESSMSQIELLHATGYGRTSTNCVQDFSAAPQLDRGLTCWRPVDIEAAMMLLVSVLGECQSPEIAAAVDTHAVIPAVVALLASGPTVDPNSMSYVVWGPDPLCYWNGGPAGHSRGLAATALMHFILRDPGSVGSVIFEGAEPEEEHEQSEPWDFAVSPAAVHDLLKAGAVLALVNLFHDQSFAEHRDIAAKTLFYMAYNQATGKELWTAYCMDVVQPQKRKIWTAAQRQEVLAERDAASILYFQCYNAGAATMYQDTTS